MHADFRELLLAELDSLFRFARHLTRDPAAAEDLVQETYVRALASAHTFTTPHAAGARPWLFKILHNLLIKKAVKDKRERDVLRERSHFEPAVSDSTIDLASTHQGEGQIDWEQVDERLKAAINDLAMPFRTTFLLSAVEGLKYREIAEITEVPLGTVMSRLARARQHLLARLGDVAAEQRLFNKTPDPHAPPTDFTE